MPESPPRSSKPVLEKMGVKAGFGVLTLNVPDSALAELHPPAGVTVNAGGEGPFDAVVLFVQNKAEVDALGPGATAATKPGGLLWVAYPKRSKGVTTDINRDSGWDALSDAGWEGVAMVAINDLWAALRFRPVTEIPGGKRRSPK